MFSFCLGGVCNTDLIVYREDTFFFIFFLVIVIDDISYS